MIPGIWLVIEAKPITSSGKIGCIALAQWLDTIQTDPAASHIDHPEVSDQRRETAPADESEAIIQKLLGIRAKPLTIKYQIRLLILITWL